MRRATGNVIASALGVLTLVCWLVAGTGATAAGAPRVLQAPESERANSGPATRPEVKDLDDRIKAMRDQFHAQLDPLEAQIKALRDKFEPQIKALEDQRKDLIEQAKSPAMRDLDTQEAADLANLADHEKAEIDKVHRTFSDEKKAIQQKYQLRRHAMHDGSK